MAMTRERTYRNELFPSLLKRKHQTLGPDISKAKTDKQLKSFGDFGLFVGPKTLFEDVSLCSLSTTS